MKWYTKIQLEVSKFFKKHSKVMIAIIVIWGIVILLNYIMKNQQKEIKPKTTYKPDEPVMDDGDSVPNQLKDPIKQTIEEYFNYCNAKKYQLAFDMLTDDCKEYLYDNNIENFMEYINKIFDKNKIYNLQNYSNKDNVYIYSIHILDNILATGTTGSSEFEYYEEKMAAIKDGDKIKLTNNNYVRKEECNIIGEENYMRLSIDKREVSYKEEVYSITVRNKSDYYVVLYDGSLGYSEIQLSVGGTERNVSLMQNEPIYLLPNETRTFDVKFDKFYDELDVDEAIKFNSIRVLKQYYGYVSTDLEELKKDAVKLYSLTFNLASE